LPSGLLFSFRRLGVLSKTLNLDKSQIFPQPGQPFRNR
jgi:hypothetical protein